MIQNIIKSQADSFAKDKSSLELYKGVIALFIVISGAVSIYSVYASYMPIRGYIIASGMAGDVIAWLSTILLELITISLVYTTLYMLFKKYAFIQILPFLLVGIGAYGFNFMLSTSGLSERAVVKVDKVGMVNDSINQIVTRLESNVNRKIDSLSTANILLQSKNKLLNYNQLQANNLEKTRLFEYLSTEKSRLLAEKNILISENKDVKNTKGAKAYSFFAIIQILQIVVNALITFLFIKIRNEEMSEDEQQAEIARRGTQQRKELKQAVAERMLDEQQRIGEILSGVQSDNKRKPLINHTVAQTNEPKADSEPSADNKKKIVYRRPTA